MRKVLTKKKCQIRMFLNVLFNTLETGMRLKVPWERFQRKLPRQKFRRGCRESPLRRCNLWCWRKLSFGVEEIWNLMFSVFICFDLMYNNIKLTGWRNLKIKCFCLNWNISFWCKILTNYYLWLKKSVNISFLFLLKYFNQMLNCNILWFKLQKPENKCFCLIRVFNFVVKCYILSFKIIEIWGFVSLLLFDSVKKFY